jgi:uncharacterized membrane protein YjjP (DUF1212 family)
LEKPKPGDRTELESVEALDLLECMRGIGKGMLASGSPAGVVENTLTEIALVYQKSCEIVALPNTLLIKLGSPAGGITDFSVQRLESMLLNRISALGILIEDVKTKRIPVREASQQLDRILVLPQRFNSLLMIFGYVISIIGLTLRFRPEPKAILITGSMGLLVAILIEIFKKQPRFNLLLPVFSATIVSAIIFNLTQQGYIFGSSNLIIPPLVTFLPGVILTTGMIDLASTNLISGSSRVMYGAATLFLLFIGIAVGLSISQLSSSQVLAYETPIYSLWLPLLGTLLFGVGTFVRLSGSNRDLLWMLLVLYTAMLGQLIGESLINTFFGAFLGAAAMAFSSELIGRSPHRTPAMVSQALAFWFLVPGATGLQSMTSILTKDYFGAMIGLGQMVVLITVIALGVFLGTLVISPNKFIPIKGYPEKPKKSG